MVYFGLFFVLPNYVRFPDFNSKIPGFYADIINLYLYLRMMFLYVIGGWCALVTRSRKGWDVRLGKFFYFAQAGT